MIETRNDIFKNQKNMLTRNKHTRAYAYQKRQDKNGRNMIIDENVVTNQKIKNTAL